MKTCKGCKHYKKDEITRLIVCEFGLHESYCEKDKEDFAIEELKKIKTEIEKEQEPYITMWENGFDDVSSGKYRAFNKAIDIIVEHIDELKGEN